MGTWLLGSFLAITVLICLLGQRESRLVILTERNLPLQLLAEDLLEEQRITLQEDFDKTENLLAMEEWRVREVEAGERDGRRYRVTCRCKDGKLILVARTEYIEEMMLGNVYMLQWCLHADREQKKVVLERIG